MPEFWVQFVAVTVQSHTLTESKPCLLNVAKFPKYVMCGESFVTKLDYITSKR